MNNHIIRIEKNSRLIQRALKLAVTMPLNHPDFQNTIIEKLCKPNGYYQVSGVQCSAPDHVIPCLAFYAWVSPQHLCTCMQQYT
jgi:hypothetical protein